MKKLSVKVLAFCAAAFMAMSFASCRFSFTSSSTDSEVTTSQVLEETEKETEEVTEEETEEETEEKTDHSSLKPYTSVEEYINSDEIQSQLESAFDIIEGSGMEMKVFAEGDTLVYEYKYSTQLSNVDTVAEAIGNSTDGQSSTFETLVEELELMCDVENPQVKLVYLNADGNEIYSKIFG